MSSEALFMVCERISGHGIKLGVRDMSAKEGCAWSGRTRMCEFGAKKAPVFRVCDVSAQIRQKLRRFSCRRGWFEEASWDAYRVFSRVFVEHRSDRPDEERSITERLTFSRLHGGDEI